MVREYPEYKDARQSDDKVEKVVEELYSEQDAIVREYAKAEISRELIRMAARGEAEYDPEQDAWRMIR
jgi:hypothetical protein